MSKIISVHSFRGGTGKSNTTANLATLLAMEGKRVCVIDTDIQSPGVHVLFGLNEDELGTTLNDYLWGNCDITAAAQDVTKRVGGNIKGQIYLVPSSIKPGDIARILRESFDGGLLSDGFQKLVDDLNLDALIIDTHPGLNEETLLSIATSDALVIVMRPDQQDYQGTGVTVSVARKLDVPNMVLVVNKTPSSFNMADVKARVEKTYGCEVAAVLPHSDELMTLASNGVFVARYPDNSIAQELKKVAARLMR